MVNGVVLLLLMLLLCVFFPFRFNLDFREMMMMMMMMVQRVHGTVQCLYRFWGAKKKEKNNKITKEKKQNICGWARAPQTCLYQIEYGRPSNRSSDQLMYSFLSIICCCRWFWGVFLYLILFIFCSHPYTFTMV